MSQENWVCCHLYVWRHTSPHPNSLWMKSQGWLCRTNNQVHLTVVGIVPNKVNGFIPTFSEGMMKQFSGDNLVSERLLWWMNLFLLHCFSSFHCHPFILPIIIIAIISIGITFLLQKPINGAWMLWQVLCKIECNNSWYAKTFLRLRVSLVYRHIQIHECKTRHFRWLGRFTCVAHLLFFAVFSTAKKCMYNAPHLFFRSFSNKAWEQTAVSFYSKHYVTKSRLIAKW